MTERNPYSRYNYDTFDQTPLTRRRGQEDTLKERIMARFSNPVFATAALLLAGVAFAGIIIASYPDSSEDADVPIVQADAGALREQPEDRGGFEVAHQDSTVYSNIRAAELQETAPVEDLLAKEKPIDKLEAFAKEAESMFDEEAAPPQPAETAAAEAASETTPPPTELKAEAEAEIQAGEPSNDNLKTVKIEQKVEKVPLVEGGTPVAKTVPAGTSPDTLAFVKSVLNEKDAKSAGEAPTQAVNTQADTIQPQAIEPAAGAATGAKTTASGSYYVQLASVDAESKASVEWKNLQKKFSSLSGQQFRVQRADLAKGTFYRIQAGPMDKATATSVCDSIKAQKPGGCLLVK